MFPPEQKIEKEYAEPSLLPRLLGFKPYAVGDGELSIVGDIVTERVDEVVALNSMTVGTA